MLKVKVILFLKKYPIFNNDLNFFRNFASLNLNNVIKL